MTLRSLNRAVGEIDGTYVSEAENYFSAQGWQRRRRTRVLLLVAAILTALIAIGCAAVSYFEMDDVLKDFLGIEDEYNEELDEGVSMIEQTKTVGGVTVAVDQMFGDPHAAWIVFRVTVDDWVPLEKSEKIIPGGGWENFVDVLIDVDSKGGGYSWSCVDTDEETRTKTYILQCHGTRINLINRRMNFTITGYEWFEIVEEEAIRRFANIDEEGNTKNIEFSFQANYQDMTEVFRVNQKYGEYEVKEVRISPASTIIRISGLPKDQYYFENCFITLKDGTKVQVEYQEKIKDIWWSGSCDIYAVNAQIVDVSEVESVSFSVENRISYTVYLG